MPVTPPSPIIPGTRSPNPHSTRVPPPSPPSYPNTQASMSMPGTPHSTQHNISANLTSLPLPVTNIPPPGSSIWRSIHVFVSRNTTALAITTTIAILGIAVSAVYAARGVSLSEDGRSLALQDLALQRWTARRDFRVECEKNKVFHLCFSFLLC